MTKKKKEDSLHRRSQASMTTANTFKMRKFSGVGSRYKDSKNAFKRPMSAMESQPINKDTLAAFDSMHVPMNEVGKVKAAIPDENYNTSNRA